MLSRVLFGVPCSLLKDKVKDGLFCCSEEVAFAVAFGAILAGKEPVVFMQNSGLGRVVDVVASLYKAYGVKLPKLILGLRRSPEHHRFMGEISFELLRLIEYDGKVEVIEENRSS